MKKLFFYFFFFSLFLLPKKLTAQSFETLHDCGNVAGSWFESWNYNAVIHYTDCPSSCHVVQNGADGKIRYTFYNYFMAEPNLINIGKMFTITAHAMIPGMNTYEETIRVTFSYEDTSPDDIIQLYTSSDGENWLAKGSPVTGQTNYDGEVILFSNSENHSFLRLEVKGVATEETIALSGVKVEGSHEKVDGLTVNELNATDVTLSHANGSLYVSMDGLEDEANLTLYDLHGRKLHQTYATNNTVIQKNLQKGIYLLTIAYGDQLIWKKIFID